jgi:hypothetical protein
MIYVYTAVCIPLEVPCDMANTGTKDKKKQLNSKVFANSSRVRCAIYSCDTAIRIYSVPPCIWTKKTVRQNSITGQSYGPRRTPQSASTASHHLNEKTVCQNSIMGQSYGPRRIFLRAITCLDFPKYGHILGKTLCSGPRPQAPARQASPWGHRPSSSEPCAVPMRLCRNSHTIFTFACKTSKKRNLLYFLQSF